MPAPHGGRLIDRLVPESKRERVREEAEELPRVLVSMEKRKDLENIAYGIYSPLEGPLTGEDYRLSLIHI